MKNRLSAVLATLVIVGLATRAIGRSRPVRTNVGDQFVGAWRLVALDERDTSGHTHHCDCTGMFVFTRDGHAAVQVMYPHPQAAAGSGYAQGGYEATFGSYVVEERTHTFTLHVAGALVRSLIGKDLARRYELAGNRLVVRSTRTDEYWSVTWERY